MHKIVLSLLICATVCINCAVVDPRRSATAALDTAQPRTSVESNSINDIETENKPDVCTKDICVKESEIMKNYLDEDVNPCENFYDFACGKFLKNTVIRENRNLEISFVWLKDKVEEQLRQILIESVLPHELKSFTLAKIFQQSCVNETARNELGVTQMMEILDKYGGWPVVAGDWNSEKWDWMDTYKKISSDGICDAIILNFDIVIDAKNSSKRVIAIKQPEFGISQKFLLQGTEESNIKAYFDFMVDAAVIFGANKSRAEVELREALQFEMELAKIALPSEERQNKSILYNPYTIEQLQREYPYINWLEFINWNLCDELNVNGNETIIITDTNFLTKLNRILEITSKRTVANYIAWRSVLRNADLLNDALHQRRQEFLAKTNGMQKADPRETECAILTRTYLPISVSAMYVRRYSDEESKKAAIELYKNINAEFIKILETVDWMDESTRKEAIEKENRMYRHIAYPVEMLDDNKIEQYHQDLQLDANFLYNVLRIRKFDKKRFINKLPKSVNKTDWETLLMPIIVNAGYDPSSNSIHLPAAILQDRFFSINRPSYMNYATIGWIIGHEMTHGFDNEGRQFDYDGNLVDWWQYDTAHKFASKAQCIIDQYSNYTDPRSNLRVNGKNTQGENIADNGAVKEIYTAYQSFVERNGPEPILPNLNYTQNQLFWISAAQIWCAASRPAFDVRQYTTDVHSPGRYRIIGTFSNMVSFSKDFNCAPGTNMNRANKCEVW